jgi:hypothetical protein
MPLQTGTVGGISLNQREFKEIVLEVTEDAIIARQAAYETVMELFSKRKTVTSPAEAREILATLGIQGFAAFAAQDPEGAADLMKLVNEPEEVK